MQAANARFAALVVILTCGSGSVATDNNSNHDKYVEVAVAAANADSRQICAEKLACALGAEGRFESQWDRLMVKGMEAVQSAGSAGTVGQGVSDAARKIVEAWRRGDEGRDCDEVAPSCALSKTELLDAHFGKREPQHEESDHPRRVRRQQAERKPVMQLMRSLMNTSDIMEHPFRTPKNSEMRAECRSCEAERSSCFMFSIGSYAACGVASFMAGFAGSAVCNVVTTPRSITCYLNTYQNCYRRDCGMVNLDFF